MKVLFYSRPWSYDLHVALEDHWRAAGEQVEARYITHQLQAARALERAGRPVTLIPRAVAELGPHDAFETLAVRERYMRINWLHRFCTPRGTPQTVYTRQ